MDYIECPYCGEMNIAIQKWCDDCQALLNEEGFDRHQIDDIVTRPFKLDEQGHLEIPTEPGLGIELDDERLGYYQTLEGG